MNDSKIYKGQPRRFVLPKVLGELVPNQYKASNWYKSFLPAHIDQVEINKSTNQQINKSTNHQIAKSTNKQINKSTNQQINQQFNK